MNATLPLPPNDTTNKTSPQNLLSPKEQKKKQKENEILLKSKKRMLEDNLRTYIRYLTQQYQREIK